MKIIPLMTPQELNIKRYRKRKKRELILWNRMKVYGSMIVPKKLAKPSWKFDVKEITEKSTGFKLFIGKIKNLIFRIKGRIEIKIEMLWEKLSK